MICCIAIRIFFILQSVNLQHIYDGVCIHLSFIHLLCRYSLLVAFILCRANICVNFYNFLHTWHCRINTIFVYFRKIWNSFALASKQEIKARQKPFFFLFVNLIQQFYVCRYIDIVYIYIYANVWFYRLKC